jgi:hypothetical protein
LRLDTPFAIGQRQRGSSSNWANKGWGKTQAVQFAADILPIVRDIQAADSGSGICQFGMPRPEKVSQC